MNRLKEFASKLAEFSRDRDDFNAGKGEKEILQLNRLYSTFSRIYKTIVTVHDKEEIFRRICKIAVEYGKLQMAWFGMIDESRQFLRPVAFSRKNDSRNSKNKSGFSYAEQSMCPPVEAIREGHCIFCKDIATDPKMLKGLAEAKKRGFSSSISVPVKENSVVTGAFTTYSFEPMMFGEQELQLFEEIGLAISFALDMIETEKQRNSALIDLERSEERFRELFDNAPLAYHELDDRGRIVRINHTELSMLGYTAEEVIGEYEWKFAADKEEAQKRVIELLTGIKIKGQNTENNLIRKDGSVITVLAENRLIKSEDGKVNGIRTILQDISERKKAEKELLLAKEKAEESDRLKSAFLDNISHEIRTPMNAIVGYSRILKKEMDIEEREHYTEIIIQSSNQLLSIITNIVNIATVDSGQEKVSENEINLNATIRQLSDQYIFNAKTRNISMSFNTVLPDDESCIVTDETKLKEILDNLIGNALKFSSNGSVTFGYEIKGKFLEFYVKDSGIGIPASKHQDIFKRFYQIEMTTGSQISGSGLGLAISKAYVELLGGKIWLTSEQGKGSEFFFTIPYRKSDFKKLKDKQLSNKLVLAPGSLKTLLIAEDEDLNFRLIEKLLSESNVRIIRAKNGLEAVNLCSDPQVDVVLMDIKMPELNGYEATRRIKEIRPDLPIIVQTAYINESDKKKIFDCGCSDLISKPININLLLAKIQGQLDNH
jgi:PAS domain S-box-containing protein